MVRKLINVFLMFLVLASICFPLSNAHLGKAEANVDWTGWSFVDTAGQWYNADNTYCSIHYTNSGDNNFNVFVVLASKTWTIAPTDFDNYYYRIKVLYGLASDQSGQLIDYADLYRNMNVVGTNLIPPYASTWHYELWRKPKRALQKGCFFYQLSSIYFFKAKIVSICW